MICIDPKLVLQYGWNAALIVERIFFLTYNRKCEHPQFVAIDGRRWWDSSAHEKRLDALLHQFKVDGELLLSKRTLQNTLAKLSPPAEGEEVAPSDGDEGEKAAPYLLDVVHTASSIRMAINFDGLREAVGDAAFERYKALMDTPNSQGEKAAPSENQGEEVTPSPEGHDDGQQGQGEEAPPSHDQGEKAAPSSYIEESKYDESLKDSSSDEDGAALTLTPHQALVEMFYEVTFGCVPGRKTPTTADYKRVNKQISNITDEFEKPTADMMVAWLVWRVFLDTWNRDASMPTKPSDVPPTWARFLQFHKKDPNWMARFESKYPGWRDYIYTTCNPSALRQTIQANVAASRTNHSKPRLRNYQLGIHEPKDMIPMTEEEIRATAKLIES